MCKWTTKLLHTFEPSSFICLDQVNVTSLMLPPLLSTANINYAFFIPLIEPINN